MKCKRDLEFMEAVYNAIKDGYSHNVMIREQVGQTRGRMVDHYLRYLLEAGRIEKVRTGVYVVATKSKPKKAEKPLAKGHWASIMGWIK